MDEKLLEVLCQEAHLAAPRLLGSVIRSVKPDGVSAVRVSEVEAYEGKNDPASHAGRKSTPRNAVMFREPGRVYVYRSYGMHYCFNIVCNEEGTAGGVLIRAGEVVEGEDLVRKRRGLPDAPGNLLARSPGNAARALGVDLSDNASKLGERLFLELAENPLGFTSGPRVGVSRGQSIPWRFYLPSSSVSAFRAAKALE